MLIVLPCFNGFRISMPISFRFGVSSAGRKSPDAPETPVVQKPRATRRAKSKDPVLVAPLIASGGLQRAENSTVVGVTEALDATRAVNKKKKAASIDTKQEIVATKNDRKQEPVVSTSDSIHVIEPAAPPRKKAMFK